MPLAEIHISDVRTFKQCRRKWWWSSPLGRNLEPNVPYAPFFSGRAVHYALEMYYGKKHVPFQTSLDKFFAHEEKEMGTLWPIERNTFNEQVELVRGITDHYKLWSTGFEGRFADDKLEFLSLEQSFRVPIFARSGRKSTKVMLSGRFDGVVKVAGENGDTYWIWEIKTTRSIEELTHSLANDEQAGAYIWAAQQMYKVPITGVLYNILRKKVPTQPRVLQNGMLSVAKDIDTTAEAYFNAIHTLHPDWKMETIQEYYGEILDTLIQKGNTFFSRFPVYRTQVEIETLAENLHATALEMTRPTTVRYPTPGWMNCKFCHFRSPCLAMNAGADVEFMLEHEYRQRGDPNEWRDEEEEAK